jgi:hypothetical protein
VPLLSLSFSPFFLPPSEASPVFVPSVPFPESEFVAREAEFSAGFDLFDFVLLKGFHLFDIDLDKPPGLVAGSGACPPEVTVVNT